MATDKGTGKTQSLEEKPSETVESKGPAKRKNDQSTSGMSAPSLTPAQRMKLVSAAALIILSSTFGFLGGWYGSEAHNGSSSSLSSSTTQKVITSESQLISKIAKEVGPSVVSVNVTSSNSTQDVFGGYFGFGGAAQQESAGTGFIVSTDGIVVTNRHVVPAGTTSVSITLSDGTTLDNVEVIGRTSESDPLDIAFLKIKDTKGKKLQAVTLGNSSSMQVGDKVVAIGNALGQFQNTVTTGIISGYGRSVEAGSSSGQGGTETLQNLFQTDAAINEGNSGGPLVNTSGQVIGINTAVAGNAQNIGFAIPINDVQGLIQSVLKTGKLQRPYLGVRYIPITDDYAYQYNLPVKRGAYIPPSSGGIPTSIISGSPAEKAGLKEKDIITKVDNTEINETNSLSSILGRYEVGQKATLTIIRDGKTITVTVMLEAAPSS